MAVYRMSLILGLLFPPSLISYQKYIVQLIYTGGKHQIILLKTPVYTIVLGFYFIWGITI
jgi:hypothetical protein